MTATMIVFWTSLGLIVYTHVGYPLLLRALVKSERGQVPQLQPLPRVSLIIAAHNEQAVIERKLQNALALDYPPRLLEVIIASDGSSDRTVELARAWAAGSDRVRVLELPRLGKVKAQDAAVEAATGELLAFSDANAYWKSDALRALAARFVDRRVGYVCGELRYLVADGSNQESAYWRLEMATRARESALGSITAGNGAIYAVRRNAYLRLDPRTSHDLSFPFSLVKCGWRAVYEPRARAVEQPLATIEGEFSRKRRMMAHAWPTIVRGGLLDPRGYGFVYAFEIFSHRALRYATPLLHLIALVTNVLLLGEGAVYVVTLLAQLVFAMAAAMGALTRGRSRPLALPYYYVLVMASLVVGLWDWLRAGTPTTWEKAEGRT